MPGFGPISSAPIGALPDGGAAPPVSTVSGITITPPFATMLGGSVLDFNAVVEGIGGPSQAVTWAIDLGGVDTNGTVTAPASTGSTQTAHLTATSDQDPGYSAIIVITIPSTGAVALTGTVTFRPLRTKPTRVVRIA